MLPRRAIASNLDALAEAWAWTERDVVTHALPLFHVHGLVIGILGPLRRGGRRSHLGSLLARGGAGSAGRASDDAVRRPDHVPAAGRRRRRQSPGWPGAGRRPAARLRLGGAAGLRARAPASAHRPRGRRALRDDRDADEHRRPRRRRRRARDRRAAAARRRRAAGRRRRERDRRLATRRRSARSRSAVPTCSSATSTARTPPRRRCTTAGFATGDMATRDADGYIRIVGRRATDLIKSGGYKIGAGRDRGLRCASIRRCTTPPSPASPTTTSASASSPGWCCAPAGGAGAAELIDHVAAAAGPAQAPARDPLPRRAAPQRARQGPEAAAVGGRVGPTPARRPSASGSPRG